VKFVEIVSTRCVEKYPDALLPSVLIYKDGNIYSQMAKATPQTIRKSLDVIQEHIDGQAEQEQ